jgi:hypothetical protein
MTVGNLFSCLKEDSNKELYVLDPYGVLRRATFTLSTDNKIVIVPEGHGKKNG